VLREEGLGSMADSLVSKPKDKKCPKCGEGGELPV